MRLPVLKPGRCAFVGRSGCELPYVPLQTRRSVTVVKERRRNSESIPPNRQLNAVRRIPLFTIPLKAAAIDGDHVVFAAHEVE
jgi:hypothetical protein